ncbi:hypothetical protein [Streptomyces sp. SD15]
MTTQNAINWPERCLPGTGDNFVSNEVIVRGPQIGEPAAALADERPNPMLNGHQAWLDGLVDAASGKTGA